MTTFCGSECDPTVLSLDKAEILAAYEALKAGEPGALARLQQAAYPLGPLRVNQFFKGTTASTALAHRAQLFSDVSTALVVAVNKLGQGVSEGKEPKSNIVAYLNATATNALRTSRQESPIFGPCANTRRAMIKRGETVPEQAKPFIVEKSRVYSADDDVVSYEEIADNILYGADDSYDRQAANDLLTAIYECCETEEERKVVDLRREYRTDEEIGAILGRDKSTIYRIRKRVEARFDALDLAA